MNMIPNFLKTIGNEHVEAGRLLWFIATLALIGYQGFAIWWNKQPFSPMEFGAGAGAILAAGGFGVAAKDQGVAQAAKTGEDK